MHLKKEDQVVVISGNHKGKRGRVLRVIPKEGRILIEGVNVRVKNLKKSTANPQGGRVELEVPIGASNALLWSEKAGKGVRTKIVTEKGRKIRVGVNCGTKFD